MDDDDSTARKDSSIPRADLHTALPPGTEPAAPEAAKPAPKQ